MIELALYQPDIAPNAGSMLRMCACLGLTCRIIEPAGFLMSDSRFRRAGMDYLDQAALIRDPSWQAFRQATAGRRSVLMTTRASLPYWDFRFHPDDVILLGDLNAGPPQFGSFRRIPGVGWAVSGVTTNTRRSKTYDNLVFAQPATAEYLGMWGVLDLQNTFGLPLETALEVSDHNPVWAAFHPCESRPTAVMAAQPALVR
jgi:tRNA(Leu) C34 or U34 (ribose-2'-O)-methylase TrmL